MRNTYFIEATIRQQNHYAQLQEQAKTSRSPRSETSTCCHSDAEEDPILSSPLQNANIAISQIPAFHYTRSQRQYNSPGEQQLLHKNPQPHPQAPLRERDTNRKLKNELCRNYLDYGFCPYNKKCQFAHGSEQLRQNNHNINDKYKTKECRSFFQNGYCAFGVRCNFLHRRKQSPEAPNWERIEGISMSIVTKASKDAVYQNHPELVLLKRKASRLFPLLAEDANMQAGTSNPMLY